MSGIVEALVGRGAAIADAVTLGDLGLPVGAAIVDAEGLVWQFAPPEFNRFWFPANGFRGGAWEPGGFGGPEFPVHVIYRGPANERA